MKILHILFLLVFVVFAYWQINDPDPIRWVSIYLGVSISALLFLLDKHLPLIPLIGLIACVAGLILLTPEFITWVQQGMPTITGAMKAESPHVEYVREFLGFVLAGIFYFYYAKHMYRHKKSLI